ncbi:hypothetical protein LIER_35936 [Lithospermum erythrorhizon]|uniref:Uncharacterized protein n=1 Tax=Lithospermum erythrorhizon TaxID=34254 RepID=A0AAV3NYF0_LITER
MGNKSDSGSRGGKRNPEISKTYQKKSKGKKAPKPVRETADGWPIPLQVVPSSPESSVQPEEEDISAYNEKSSSIHNVPRVEKNKGVHSDDSTNVGDDIILPNIGKKAGELSVTDTLNRGSEPQLYGEEVLGTQYNASTVENKGMEDDYSEAEKDTTLHDADDVIGVTPSDNTTRNDSDDSTTVANILKGLREEQKGQLNVDEMDTMGNRSNKMRRLRKGVPTGHVRNEPISKVRVDEGLDADVVFVFEKTGTCRKRTRASLAAAREAAQGA